MKKLELSGIINLFSAFEQQSLPAKFHPMNLYSLPVL